MKPAKVSVQSDDDLSIKEHWKTGHCWKTIPIIWTDIQCTRSGSDSYARTYMGDLPEDLSEVQETAGEVIGQTEKTSNNLSPEQDYI